jgi:hypothetical protein
MQLDYLFIPYHSHSHYILLGIVPKERFLFAIDFGNSSYSIEEWSMKGLLF